MTRKNILLVGATGFIGRTLGISLYRAGYDLTVLTRNPSKAKKDLPFPCETVAWEENKTEGAAAKLQVPLKAVESAHAVINLAGESIADGRWTAERKKILRDSRVSTTEAISSALAAAKKRPSVWIQTSATGLYGPRGSEELTETSTAGEGFLAEICKDWEAAAVAAKDPTTRLVLMRIGVVLGLDGGALPKLAALRQRGASIVIGSGSQWLSWIHIDDLVNLIVTSVEDNRYEGPVNGVAPMPCTWGELNDALSGSSLPPVKAPSVAIRLTTGEGPLALAASQKIIPKRALDRGFSFAYPTLDAALTDLLGPKDQRRDGWLFTRQFIPAPLAKVAPFFADEKNLEAITPPWLNFRVLDKSTPEIGNGTLIRYQLKLHGIPMKWITQISNWDPSHGFVDEQLKGPYAKWVHRHTFEPFAGGTLMTDYVRFRLPLGTLGNLAAGWAVNHDVSKIFAYRREFIGKLYSSNKSTDS